MTRRHTTGPVQPIHPLAAISPVGAHRRGVPAQAMLQRAVQFYRNRLRAMRARREPGGGDQKA